MRHRGGPLKIPPSPWKSDGGALVSDSRGTRVLGCFEAGLAAYVSACPELDAACLRLVRGVHGSLQSGSELPGGLLECAADAANGVAKARGLCARERQDWATIGEGRAFREPSARKLIYALVAALKDNEPQKGRTP
jgi:hypothetical protein